MRRRRSIPWIYRRSRYIIGAIATIGILETAFLTVAELSASAAEVCPTKGCELVLESPYATVFGIPLTVFGFLAYTSMAILAIAPLFIDSERKKQLRARAENFTWLLMFGIATAMVVFSSQLTYLMFFEIKALCPYCIVSAVLSVLLFVLTTIGKDWEDKGQLFFTGIAIAMVTLIGALGVYANVNEPVATSETVAGKTVVPGPSGRPTPGIGWSVKTTSGEAEIALAKHLTEIDAKVYVAYTCPHCHEQKELFGKPGLDFLNTIECHPEGKNAQPQLCQQANITGVPTWGINEQMYPGVRSLEELADLSGYQGPRDFRYSLPLR